MIFNMVGGGANSKAFALVLVNYPQNSTLTATNVDGYKDIFPSSSTNPQRLYYVSEPSGSTQECQFTITNGIKTNTKIVSGITIASSQTTTIDYKTPDGYTEVEYLQATGTQYLTTGITPNLVRKINIKFLTDTLEQWDGVFGSSGNTNGTNGVNLVAFYSSNDGFFRYDGSENMIPVGHANIQYTLSATISNGSQILIINGTTYSSSLSGTINSTYPIYIFGTNYANTIKSSELYKGKIYSFELLDSSDNKLCELIPAYRNSDNVAGMWDTVSQRFCTNLGSGTFIVGGDVN